MQLVESTMVLGRSTRSGSVLSGDKPGASRLDLNRQFTQTLDPQGIYLTDSAGTPYGFTNDHGYDDIRSFLDMADKNIPASGVKNAVIAKRDLNDMFHVPIPKDCQVFEVRERIPNVPKGCSLLNHSLGRDFAWIYASEQKQILSQLKLRRNRFALPKAIMHRLARFHFVDGVRGTPTLWKASEVRSAVATLSFVRLTPDGYLMTLSGSFSLATASKSRSYVGLVTGLILVNPQTGQWEAVRLIARGLHQGTGQYTPNAPPGKYLLLIGLQDTTMPAARIVPPEKVATDGNTTAYKYPF